MTHFRYNTRYFHCSTADNGFEQILDTLNISKPVTCRMTKMDLRAKA